MDTLLTPSEKLVAAGRATWRALARESMELDATAIAFARLKLRMLGVAPMAGALVPTTTDSEGDGAVVDVHHDSDGSANDDSASKNTTLSVIAEVDEEGEGKGDEMSDEARDSGEVVEGEELANEDNSHEESSPDEEDSGVAAMNVGEEQSGDGTVTDEGDANSTDDDDMDDTASGVLDEGVPQGEEQIPAAEAATIREDRAKAEAAARMDTLRQALNIGNLERRLQHDSDETDEHLANKPSEGVLIKRENDKWETAVITVRPGTVLRLGAESRGVATDSSEVTNSGKRRIDTPQHLLTGSAIHRFAKKTQEYFTGGRTAPPNVFRYGEPFGRRHTQPLSVRIAEIPRPYRDALTEALLHYWDQLSTMSRTEFNEAITLAINDGYKGPSHSIHQAVKREKRQTAAAGAAGGANGGRERGSVSGEAKKRTKRKAGNDSPPQPSEGGPVKKKRRTASQASKGGRTKKKRQH